MPYVALGPCLPVHPAGALAPRRAAVELGGCPPIPDPALVEDRVTDPAIQGELRVLLALAEVHEPFGRAARPAAQNQPVRTHGAFVIAAADLARLDLADGTEGGF